MRFLLTIFLAAIFLVGCDKKEDPIPASLIGKWNITGLKTKLFVEGKSLKDFLISQGVSPIEAQQTADAAEAEYNPAEELNGTMEFKADGTWEGIAEGDDDDDKTTGTWKLSDDKKTLSLFDDDDSNDTGDEGSLVDLDSATVVTLTATDLQLDFIFGGDDDVFPIDYYVSMTLKRITP